MSSFGGLSHLQGGAEDPADDRGNDPFAADRPVVAEPDLAQPDAMSGMLDMSAFGMAHMAGSAQQQAPKTKFEQQTEGVTPRAPAAVPRPETLEPSGQARAGSAAGTGSPLEAARLRSRVSDRHAWQAAFAAPEAESLEPLSAAELTDLERLLLAAAGLQDPPVAGRPNAPLLAMASCYKAVAAAQH